MKRDKWNEREINEIYNHVQRHRYAKNFLFPGDPVKPECGCKNQDGDRKNNSESTWNKKKLRGISKQTTYLWYKSMTACDNRRQSRVWCARDRDILVSSVVNKFADRLTSHGLNDPFQVGMFLFLYKCMSLLVKRSQSLCACGLVRQLRKTDWLGCMWKWVSNSGPALACSRGLACL